MRSLQVKHLLCTSLVVTLYNCFINTLVLGQNLFSELKQSCDPPTSLATRNRRLLPDDEEAEVQDEDDDEEEEAVLLWVNI